MNSKTTTKKPASLRKPASAKKTVGRPKLPDDLVKVKISVAVLPATYEFLQRHGLDNGRTNVSLGLENVVAKLKDASRSIRELRRQLKQAG